MAYQWLSSKWPAAKARRESTSFGPSRTGITCDRGATQARCHFQLNPAGRRSLGEFAEKNSLAQYRIGYRHFTRSLKFDQTSGGHWQAIPVTQHYFPGGLAAAGALAAAAGAEGTSGVVAGRPGTPGAGGVTTAAGGPLIRAVM